MIQLRITNLPISRAAQRIQLIDDLGSLLLPGVIAAVQEYTAVPLFVDGLLLFRAKVSRHPRVICRHGPLPVHPAFRMHRPNGLLGINLAVGGLPGNRWTSGNQSQRGQEGKQPAIRAIGASTGIATNG